YCGEKLREAGEEEALGDRHLAWYTGVAEEAEEPFWSPDQVAWFARLTAEEDNLRAALAWSTRTVADPEPTAATIDAGLRLAGAFWQFWDLRGHLSEGRARLRELLATGLGAPASRAKALHAGAYLVFVMGDRIEAIRLAEETVALGPGTVPPLLFA